ncbi:hypothetical protein Acr_15g0013160 [Actinidia rufa]|uniref:P-loop containing nucleoside triphosphate hydrolases superfamily protein n=1 Tax=Actinidia rufa TaxID=165716 RepID=A0A7J0FXQ9_9ERIC|nr:hypothetical protein Acr_15g0013160 [Actinidia rufa]
MPSPSLVFPSSDPSISEPHPSSDRPSNVSLRSVGLEKPTRPKKVGSFKPKKSAKKSELTEESLEEFNLRNEILDEHRKSSFTYSPYYRGLTDSTLLLNRQKLTASSPGKDSNVTSISTSSRSSFGVKMKEFGSCFTTFGKEEKVVEMKSKSKGSRHARTSSSSSSVTGTGAELTTLAKELGLEGEIVSIGFNENDEYFSTKGKPLRERDSEPPTQPPSSLPPVSTPQPPPGPPPPTYPSLQSLLPPVSPTSTPQTYMSSPQPSASTQPHTHPSTPPVLVLNIPSTQSLVPSVSARLQAKADDGCGHFIFEGPPGVGKRTLIRALLREAYGPERVMARVEFKDFP